MVAAIEVGRLCVKMAGRDAGQECVIIKVIDKNFVMIDGNTRRKKVNIDHLELLPHVLGVKEDDTHENVTKALSGMGIAIKKRGEPRAAKPKQATPKPATKKKGILKRTPKPKKAAKK